MCRLPCTLLHKKNQIKSHVNLGSPRNYVKSARALRVISPPHTHTTKRALRGATRERVRSSFPPRAILAPGPAHSSLDQHAARAPDSFTRRCRAGRGNALYYARTTGIERKREREHLSRCEKEEFERACKSKRTATINKTTI